MMQRITSRCLRPHRQRSPGDSTYHHACGDNAGLRHSLPFISAFSSSLYTVLICTDRTHYEAEPYDNLIMRPIKSDQFNDLFSSTP